MNKNEISSAIVIGAGPVGLSAAAHLLSRGIKPMVFEKGKSVGNAMSNWGHVHVFSPWKYVIDKQVKALLDKSQWLEPDSEGLPTGREIVEQYLNPAANTPELIDKIQYETEVIAISKQHHAKSSSSGREEALFNVHIRTSGGLTKIVQTQAVIDASGTWSNPNPIGLDGLPVPGELENKERIAYGIPNVAGQEQNYYANKRVLVLGGGHSAINVTLDLLTLQSHFSKTKVMWGLRTNNLDKLLGGGINDELPARGKLGLAAKKAVNDGKLELFAPFAVNAINRNDNGLTISATINGEAKLIEVDRIIVAAGFRPDLNILRELRLNLDHIVEAPKELAPLIDPNLHSCGTVPPHGYQELTHPDSNFFIAGMKAYGRAPTFLMLTGYEQVRSIAAFLAGEIEAAQRVELSLPKTGVCSSSKQKTVDCCKPTPEQSAVCCG